MRALRDRRIRDAEACYWIEGVRQFVQAFDAGLQFETIVWSPILLKSVFAERIGRILKNQGVQRVRVTPEQFGSVYLADGLRGSARSFASTGRPSNRPRRRQASRG